MQLFGSIKRLTLDEVRPFVVVDKKNPKAVALAKEYKWASHKDPNVILVLGGDGFILEAFRKYWHKLLPFFGVNLGTKGFLLNDPKTVVKGIPKEMRVYNLPLLEVEAVLKNGSVKRMHAFNDAWVERAKLGQAGWIEVKIGGSQRLPKLMADMILVATTTGSTAYALSMGTSPVPLDAQVLVLAGSMVSDPIGFKSCYLPLNSVVEFISLDGKKRPLLGFVDGIKLGVVERLKIRVSPTASVQLADTGKFGLPEKLLKIQFPKQ